MMDQEFLPKLKYNEKSKVINISSDHISTSVCPFMKISVAIDLNDWMKNDRGWCINHRIAQAAPNQPIVTTVSGSKIMLCG